MSPSKRPGAGEHRVSAISFGSGAVECVCGEAMVLIEIPDDAYLRQRAVADLFADHRRQKAAKPVLVSE